MLKATKSSWNGLSRSGSSPRRGDHARSRHAEPWERRSGCRRAQGCAHSSRTSRSAKSPLPNRSRLRLFRSPHPIPTHRVEAPERLIEEDAESDAWRPAGAGVLRLRPNLAGSYSPLLLLKSLPDPDAARPRMPQALDFGPSTSISVEQCSCSSVELRDRACVSEPPTRWKRTGLYPLPTSGQP